MNTGSDLFRRRPLPIAEPRGRIVVTEAVAEATGNALVVARGPEGRHEGMVFWAGWELPGLTLITLAIAPATEHGWGHVRANEASVAAAARRAHRVGAGILAQVHSHPGSDTRHSDGDDQLVLMPFEGMFSLVVARYGDGGLAPAGGIGVHQFQDGQWVQIRQPSAAFVVTPTIVEG